MISLKCLFLFKGMAMNHTKALVSGVSTYVQKLMIRGTDVTPGDSSTILSTTISEVALMSSARNSSKSRSTISATSVENGQPIANSTRDWKEISKYQVKADGKDLTVIDIEVQSNVPSATLENMILELGESITSQLGQITKRMDDEKNDLDTKFNFLNQKVEKLDEKRIQAKNYHHELRRRFECFENKVNKNYLK